MRTQTGTFAGARGATLHTIRWSPDDESSIRADVVLAHGYGEHSGRYAPVAEALSAAGLAVSAMDHRGHGRSTGVKKGEVDFFDLLVDDLGRYVDSVATGRPLFLYGHSMGGLASVRLAERGDSRFSGIVLTGPALATAESIPAPLVALANILGTITPWLPTISLDAAAISRDEAVRADYDSDPYNFRGKLTARTGREINRAMVAALGESANIHAPLLILHGDADRLAEVSGSRRLAAAVGSADVTLREYPGAYHELHHEPESTEVLATIIDWIGAHLSGTRDASVT